MLSSFRSLLDHPDIASGLQQGGQTADAAPPGVTADDWTTAADPTIPAGFPYATLWQYTDAGSVSGVSGAVDRDRYERDLALQARVRDAYERLSSAPDWIRVDGERPPEEIAEEVFSAVSARLVLP